MDRLYFEPFFCFLYVAILALWRMYTMKWSWKSYPPQTLSIAPGEALDFALDIDSPEGIPAITWDDSRLGEVQLQVDTQDPRKIRLVAPPDKRGFFRFSYRIDEEPHAIGIIRLRLSASQRANTPAVYTPFPELSQTPEKPAHSPIVGQATPTTAERAPSTDSPVASSYPRFSVGVYTTVHAEEQVRVEAVTDVELPSFERQDARVAPPRSAEVYIEEPASGGRSLIEVLRGETVVMRVPLEAHRSLSVGRYSSSHERPLGLDLHGVFEASEDESLCARHQAEIFQKGGKVVVQNLGANPLQVRGMAGWSRVDVLYDWKPGQDLLLPGGLRLRLVIKGG